MSAITSRRNFLKASALVTGGAMLVGCAPAAPATEQPSAETEATQAPAPAEGKTKLVFNSYTWSGYEDAMRQVIDGWTKLHPEVELEAQFVPQDDYWTKIQTMVASGTPPDSGIADYGRLVSYAKNGTLLDISEYLKAASFPLDTMFPGATAQYRWTDGEFDSGNQSGNYFGLPSDAQSQVFVYNKKMFDDAGVAYPTDDWTWDDMLAAAQKLTKPDENKWGISRIDNYILFKGNWVWAAGGALHTPDFSKSMLADPATIEAYKWNWDLIYTHKVAPPPGSMTSTNPFMTGQVAMYVDGVWWISDFVNGIKDFEWDVALFPKHPKTGKRTTSVESDGWWVYKGTKEGDLAYDLVQYLALPEQQKQFGVLNYIIPSNIPDIAKEWYAKTPPANRMKALDNITMDSAKVDFTYFEFGTIVNAVMPVIDKAFADGEDITAAMQEADTVMNEELTKAWELLKA
jgi:multiple sugar transport system substrate-binding protein